MILPDSKEEELVKKFLESIGFSMIRTDGGMIYAVCPSDDGEHRVYGMWMLSPRAVMAMAARVEYLN